MKIAVVGIGLIGGSMALDIKAAFENVEIIGIDKNENNAQKAKDLQLIDAIGDLKDLEEAEVVIVSVPRCEYTSACSSFGSRG